MINVDSPVDLVPVNSQESKGPQLSNIRFYKNTKSVKPGHQEERPATADNLPV